MFNNQLAVSSVSASMTVPPLHDLTTARIFPVGTVSNREVGHLSKNSVFHEDKKQLNGWDGLGWQTGVLKC